MPAGSDGTEESGFQHGNVGELAGRGLWGLLILYVALALAMVADLITFRQVVERVVNESNMVGLLVIALTVTTTYVAHRAGEAFRHATEIRRTIRHSPGGWLLSATWLGVGLGAFVFRLLAPAPSDGDVVATFNNSGVTTAGTASGSPTLSAVLMLLLYLLTGAIAIAAGYQRRAEVEQFRRTNRRLRWLEPRLGVLRRDVAETEALRGQVATLRDRRRAQYQVEAERCTAAARRVRAESQIIVRRVLTERNLWDRLTGRLPAARAWSTAAADEPTRELPLSTATARGTTQGTPSGSAPVTPPVTPPGPDDEPASHRHGVPGIRPPEN